MVKIVDMYTTIILLCIFTHILMVKIVLGVFLFQLFLVGCTKMLQLNILLSEPALGFIWHYGFSEQVTSTVPRLRTEIQQPRN